MHGSRPIVFSALSLGGAAVAQHDVAPSAPPTALTIAPASREGQDQIATFTLAPGLVCDLVAAEPDLCNPVAFAIDGKGRFYVAETFRINEGVFDDRSYMQWKDRDLACLTVADRLAKYREFIPNDIPKYAAIPERVRMLVDTDKNGTLDRSTVFADQFTDLADGIAAGVLPVGDDVYFTNIPKLWRLRDRDGDGVAEERAVLHDGYGVHTSLIGHDLHGLVVGPDRRLYFSIGDRGFHVEQAGRTLAYPHEGAVLRCELDGSELEVVHRGLRNPQELAFDQWGDLFTGDNNSDGGDRARFVQIVPGADSGWRIGYQWLDDRGAWNRERMWSTRHPGQSAGILPPIVNFADGPSGLVYDPGQGLPERYRDCFFLCDFRGGSSYSGVHAIRLQRRGAGFELASTQKPIWGVLATDVDFGPDGSMYVSDWVSGWNKTGKGRLYRVRTPQMANDLPLRNTANLLGSDLKARGEAQLRGLLSHKDRRVRQAAQFALVDLGAVALLADVAKSPDDRLARLHAIWGLGVLGRQDPQALASVPALLDCGDADVRAMAARILGDAKFNAAGPGLVRLLSDGNARVQREAALALARLGRTAPADCSDGLFSLLRQNDDHDPVLRHAAVFALANCADADGVAARLGDDSRAVRLGVLLALARLRDGRIAGFLTDREPLLRAEAARAIYEEPVEAALPALARLAADDLPDLPSIDWRASNANRLLGAVENGETLVHVANSAVHPPATRQEAIAILAEWPSPHGQDRVFGNWRPCVHPHAERVVAAFAAALPALLADDATAVAAAHAAGRLQLQTVGRDLAACIAAAARPTEVRLAALDALADLRAPELASALDGIDGRAPVPLRQRAISLLSRGAPEKAVPVLATLLADGAVGERQAAFEALGDLRHPAAVDLLAAWLQKLAAGEVPSAVQLDLLEAAGKHRAPELDGLLAARAAADAQRAPLGEFLVCRDGGDPQRGRSVFFDHEATRCTRCHTRDGQGGNAGPLLDGIGAKRTRDELLASLITPSAAIAEGFGATTLDLHNGGVLAGVITKDQDGMLTIVGIDGAATQVPWGDVKKRTPNGQSAMPPMGGALTRRQLRDLVAFLAEPR
jgi:quinoprotein glucose dehydrogenase